MSACLPICLHVCLFVRWLACQPVGQPACLSAHSSVRMSVCVRLSMCRLVHMQAGLLVCASIHVQIAILAFPVGPEGDRASLHHPSAVQL